MSKESRDPLFGAAVLKLSMAQKGMIGEPGFRVVYAGTLRELGITDSEVDDYIDKNRSKLDAHLESRERKE